ncbi:MAG: hypothetical protein JWL59_1854 [Chthoniobacteraceae bacterium]|nr:hypothetical protein [Chthoniobacteraceae bacterium]
MNELPDPSLDEPLKESPLVSKENLKPVEQRRYRPRRIGLFRRIILMGRNLTIEFYRWYLRRVLHMDLHPTCKFSLKVHFDRTNPRGIHIDAGTYVAFNAVILSHDMSRLIHADTRIGKNCFIGAHAIILPGIVIGDECIIGTGAIVTRDVPSHSICAGNPARIIKSGIRTREWGILLGEFEQATKENFKNSK